MKEKTRLLLLNKTSTDLGKVTKKGMLDDKEGGCWMTKKEKLDDKERDAG